MRSDVAVHELAARQHGVVTRAQCARLGLSADQLKWRLGQGALRVLHRGVYGVAAWPPTFEQSVMAACLATNGLASHRSAARLWELPAPRGRPEVITEAHRRLEGVITHRVAAIARVDRTTRHGIPVCTPARTLVDLAAVVGFDELEAAYEQAEYTRLMNLRRMRTILDRMGRQGRAGAASLRALVDGRDPALAPTESRLELAMARLMRRHGVPEPVRQHVVVSPGGERFRLDFAYPDTMLAVETDGLVCHAGADALRRDPFRSRRLVQLGWDVLAFTWAEVVDHPADVAAEILAAVSARRHAVPDVGRRGPVAPSGASRRT